MWVTSSTSNVKTPTAIALGNFDGIHLGHRKVLKPITELGGDYIPTLVSFTPHPQEFFSGETRQLLTPLDEKVKILESLKIRQLVRLPFDGAIANLSPQAFIEDILVRKLNVKYISVGKDFRFGKGREGNAETLEKVAQTWGISAHITKLQSRIGEDSGLRISSSRIRQCLAAGDVAEAREMLSYPYSLEGIVVKGQQLGRTIGFPTANLQVPSDKLLPRFGVYGVRVILATQEVINGVINIGSRPTVKGQLPTVEVHLLDWSGDLYGTFLRVHLEKFLRPEQKFPSLNALQKQIMEDCIVARRILE
ncbi:bifunctional riboflavin kinase/FAD synthetase [Crocosphaera sp. Alani8]|uniref:bifunctional riboflavin kinase/FAD synthetase n=1 Tax=Crocosphaera sp. Alani8 TaxID=3038952 RepID=UPI00313D3557